MINAKQTFYNHLSQSTGVLKTYICLGRRGAGHECSLIHKESRILGRFIFHNKILIISFNFINLWPEGKIHFFKYWLEVQFYRFPSFNISKLILKYLLGKFINTMRDISLSQGSYCLLSHQHHINRHRIRFGPQLTLMEGS